jgi:hypothetical protein
MDFYHSTTHQLKKLSSEFMKGGYLMMETSGMDMKK